MIGGPQRKAAESYRRYVEEAVRDGQRESPLEQVEAQLVLGGAALVARARQLLGRERRREQPGTRALRQRDFGAAIAVVSQIKGEPWTSFRDRYGDWGRDLALWLGPTHCGLKLRELGALAGGIDYATVSVATSRWQKRAAADKKLMKIQRTATELLNARLPSGDNFDALPRFVLTSTLVIVWQNKNVETTYPAHHRHRRGDSRRAAV